MTCGKGNFNELGNLEETDGIFLNGGGIESAIANRSKQIKRRIWQQDEFLKNGESLYEKDFGSVKDNPRFMSLASNIPDTYKTNLDYDKDQRENYKNIYPQILDEDADCEDAISGPLVSGGGWCPDSIGGELCNKNPCPYADDGQQCDGAHCLAFTNQLKPQGVRCSIGPGWDPTELGSDDICFNLATKNEIPDERLETCRYNLCEPKCKALSGSCADGECNDGSGCNKGACNENTGSCEESPGPGPGPGPDPCEDTCFGRCGSVDGCTCSSCSSGKFCNDDGLCEDKPPDCNDQICGEICGDGCACECPSGKSCDKGKCVDDPSSKKGGVSILVILLILLLLGGGGYLLYSHSQKGKNQNLNQKPQTKL